jgi:hypothetical protein
VDQEDKEGWHSAYLAPTGRAGVGALLKRRLAELNMMPPPIQRSPQRSRMSPTNTARSAPALIEAGEPVADRIEHAWPDMEAAFKEGKAPSTEMSGEVTALQNVHGAHDFTGALRASSSCSPSART